ncbi:serine/threonine-protein kinase par-1-like isoform X2 [Montipora foliosa]|uniref:serine/threonine-protein kinase par-1-like isoform X2 n=1 Tax=Montipora foliosa TaxID=591990 RepID=UPI0035F1398C
MNDSNNLVLKRIGTYDLTGYRLGKGNFAHVELATNRVTKTKVAMKIIDTRKLKDEYVKKNILREALLLKKVSHPNIVRLYETLKQRSFYCIVTEFVAGGELLSYLRSQYDSKLSESQARPIMRQLISALYHMHEQGIVHRDLKMENILLDESKKNIKIVDFGLSNICQGENLLKTQCGSPEYAAPELFRRGCRYGTEVDLWSLGVIMYGIVVGKLPFRSFHSGCRGRNDLVDQSSRGLSCTHNKYLCHLTHQCRDLLWKLLEPRPELRLPLLDVMVHSWVTVQGTAPLVPYSEEPIDEKLQDKVLEKASQLAKISKSRIAFHVQQNRYDAMAAVYNLLLDKELKLAWRSYFDQKHRSPDNSVIRVTITTVGKEKKEAENQAGTQDLESGSACKSEGSDSQAQEEEDNKHVSPKPIVQISKESSDDTKPQGLWIRGFKICTDEARFPSNFPHAKTRPNTAASNRSSVENPSRLHGAVSPTCNRSRCKSCIPRFAPKFESRLQGKQVVLSPRLKPESQTVAAEIKGEGTRNSKEKQESEFPAKERLEEDSCHFTDHVLRTDKASENTSEKRIGDDQTEKIDVNFEYRKKSEESAKNPDLADDSRVRESPETSRSDRNNLGQRLQQTSAKVATSRRTAWSPKRMPPASLAAPSPSRAVSPLKTSEFIDLADYQNYISQTHKARNAEKPGRGSKSLAKEGENEESINSFATAYQSYLRTTKPHHQRLSIMQAQEILHYESKFHSKYGRRSSTENSMNSTRPIKQSEKPKLYYSHARCISPSCASVPKKGHEQNCTFPEPGYIKGVSLQKDTTGSSQLTDKRDEYNEDQTPLSQSPIGGPNPSDESILQEDNNTMNYNLERFNEFPQRKLRGNSTLKTQPNGLNPEQEESLKRKKEKEDTESREREKVDFLKKLEDQERQKIITEYLQLMYSQNGQQTPTNNSRKKPEFNSRSFKVYKQGRVYSVVTRSPDATGSGSMQVISKPTPILHSVARGTQGEKKILIKSRPGGNSANGVRFVNDWNNNLFKEYINSSERDTTQVKEIDKLQMKDPSFWLEQHLNGVLDESTIGRRDIQNCQQLIPRET